MFKGLAIDNDKHDWKTYPILHFDLTGKDYDKITDFEEVLDEHFIRWEKEYGYSLEGKAPDERFKTIIRKAHEVTGKNVVILIDEYDQPILHNTQRPELREKFRNKMNAFYSVMKTMSSFIKFALLTGVSRFSKVTVFSGLNNLEDLSIQPQYNGICGVSESELTEYFSESIDEMAKSLGMTAEEIHAELKSNYDGYHFAINSEDIYNPFSLLNTFKSKMFGSYWFNTGTTSDLVRELEKATYPIPVLEGYRCKETLLTGSDIYLSNPVPLFFQTGYLTIKGYDRRFKQYILGFPNKEVLEGFSDYLMNSYMKGGDSSRLVSEFVMDVEAGRPEAFMRKLQSFTAGIPYDLIQGGQCDTGSRNWKEVLYQNVMFVVMKLMGFYTHTKYKTSDGRIDMLVETPDYLYVMEFKLDSTAETALQQIDDKEYTLPFRERGKKLYKIGANFSTETRRLEGWKIEEDA